MDRPENGGDGWGQRGQERHELLAAVGSSEGEAISARLEALPPAAGAVEIRWLFAQSPTARLAHDITRDLGIAPKRARLIAEEIAASRRRLEHATRPFRRRGEPADTEAD